MSNNGGGYFSHDANARNSAKIIRLRMRYGAEGYGVYFMLLERLREEQTYSCERDYDMLAFDFRVDANLIRAVVEDFSLFDIDGNRFYSRGFLARMAQKDEKSSRRSAAGRKGMQSRWSAPATDNNVMPTDNNVITNVPEADNNVITMLSQKDNNVITMLSDADNNVITKENGVITMLSENITSKVKERKEKKRKEEDDVVVEETSSSSSSSSTEEAKALSGETAHAAAPTAASANALAAKAVALEANEADDADDDQAPGDDDRIADELTALKLDMQWGEAIAMRYGIDGIELHAMINKFGIDCHANGRLHHNSLADAKSHFCSWLRIQQSHNTPRHESNHQAKAAARRGTAATAQSSSQYSTRL